MNIFCRNPGSARTYTQIHTPTVVQRMEVMELLPRVFNVLQYFEMILPLVESL